MVEAQLLLVELPIQVGEVEAQETVIQVAQAVAVSSLFVIQYHLEQPYLQQVHQL